MQPANKGKITLLVFLIVLVFGLLIFNLLYSPETDLADLLLLSKIDQVVQNKSFPVISKLIPQEKKTILFSAPVEKQYLTKAKLVQLDLGKNDLGFLLPEKTPFKAGFAGRTEITGTFPQQILILTSVDGNRRLFYIFAGKPKIENGVNVAKNAILGEVSKENLPTRDVNLIVRYFEYRDQVNLSKSLIKDLVDE